MKKFFLAFMDHFESYLCQFLLVFFVVVVFIQIILRFLDASLPWTEEIARFAFLEVEQSSKIDIHFSSMQHL